jgi:hypothetical protein
MDLVGGIHAVTLGDEEAKRRGTQKTVLERKAPPTFDTVIEIENQDRLAVHHDTALCVDRLLRGEAASVEVRWRESDYTVRKTTRAVRLTGSAFAAPPPTAGSGADDSQLPLALEEETPRLSAGRIFPYGVSRRKLESALQELGSLAVVTRNPEEADLILALESRVRTEGPVGRRDAQVLTVRSNTQTQIKAALSDLATATQAAREAYALQEAREAVEHVIASGEPVELLPQNAYLRRLQHELAAQHKLESRSVGREPRRRVRVMRG